MKYHSLFRYSLYENMFYHQLYSNIFKVDIIRVPVQLQDTSYVPETKCTSHHLNVSMPRRGHRQKLSARRGKLLLQKSQVKQNNLLLIESG